ncbi:MAG: hypothetical protein HY683_04375 [Chloroflexi bacterium]|nr:hypothetical protein [Chloroflexota bacterium]
MRPNATRRKLDAGQTVFGANLSNPSPAIVEVLGAVGFDFVALDAEHLPMNEESVEHLIRAAESFNITPIIRVPNNPDLILRYLDAGAQGVHVPQVGSAAEAKQVVDAARYYPLGQRTFYALGRSANYGVGVTEEQYAQEANRETMVVVMIEDVKAIPNLPGILALPGVDIIHIGPKDLRQSMGFAPVKEVDAAIDRIVGATVKAGKVASLGGLSPRDFERIARYAAQGVRMFTISPLDFIRTGGAWFLSSAREALGKVASPPVG